MSGLVAPGSDLIPEALHEARSIDLCRVVVVEEVGDLAKRGVRERIEIPVAAVGPHVPQSIGARSLEVRAETLEHHRSTSKRRVQKPDGGQQLESLLVVLRALTGKAVHHVPHVPDAVCRAPLQEPDVLEDGGALVHAAQDRIAEALDPGLQPDAGGSGLPHPALLDARAHFERHDRGKGMRGELGQDVTEKARGHDVVDDVQPATRPALDQLAHLAQRAPWRLGTIRSLRAAEAAEQARLARRPPAAARGLDRQHDIAGRAAAGPRLEEVRVVRRRQGVEIGERAGPWGHTRAARMSEHDAGNVVQRARMPAVQPFDDRRERKVRLARAGDIDEGKATVQLAAHHALPVMTAERDDHGRMLLTDRLGERQGGEILRPDRRETDDVVVRPRQPRSRPANESRCPSPGVQDRLDVAGFQAPHALEHLVDVSFAEPGVPPEEGLREHPFSGQRRGRATAGHAFVAVDAHQIGEGEVKVGHVAGDVAVPQFGLQQA